jgi:hypothetical protein
MALVALTCAAGACAGKTSSISDSTPTPQSDAGIGPRAPECPAAEPAQGSACTKNGLLCEYGNDYNPLCNTIVVCSTDRWASPIYSGGGGKCPSSQPIVGPNPTDCPATREDVPMGTACSTKSKCSYDGASCYCGAYCPQYPVGQMPCNPDAGVTQNCCDTSKVQWNCFGGPKYCKAPRPRIGQPCTNEGESCAIDEPKECGQTVMQCQKGIWNLENTQCPVSSARFKKDIAYVGEEEAERLRGELTSVKVARYKYKTGDDAPHLGFIIEDMPEGSPAVLPSRDRVDLYGYVSMAVLTLQRQEKEIAELKAEVARLKKDRAGSATQR